MDPIGSNFRSLPPPPPPPPPQIKPSSHSSDASFPIIAIAVIGILATAFLLVSYYVFVIKCCLNWHRIDLLGRFSLSRRRSRRDYPAAAPYSPSPTAELRRGLDESVIRSIPILRFNRGLKTEGPSECAVCLSEFQEEEKLRSIPNCGHVFHIDCIDVWLQSNANCPLCRRSISVTANRFGFPLRHNLIMAPTPSPQDPNPYLSGSSSNRVDGDEDYVVIELGESNRNPEHPFDRSLLRRRETLGSGDLLSIRSISPLRVKKKKTMKLDHRVLSMGDECIDVNRVKDEQFSAIQPIRRSFSLDSSNDPLFFKSIQEIAQQQKSNVNVISSAVEGCSSSSRLRRSLFSFGHGKGSRSSVLPINSDP